MISNRRLVRIRKEASALRRIGVGSAIFDVFIRWTWRASMTVVSRFHRKGSRTTTLVWRKRRNWRVRVVSTPQTFLPTVTSVMTASWPRGVKHSMNWTWRDLSLFPSIILLCSWQRGQRSKLALEGRVSPFLWAFRVARVELTETAKGAQCSCRHFPTHTLGIQTSWLGVFTPTQTLADGCRGCMTIFVFTQVCLRFILTSFE
mmetsp:Transcript_21499/g.30746  ORF Transcript_21499/g.30746 Transcript_21499/m.30746 type:complete len:203 (+) Transcript_21499:1965-2573(+)